MIRGEVFVAPGEIEPNAGKLASDRPAQVGSHHHFHEANEALAFDRETAWGMRLDIPAGTAVRFEPGQSRSVTLVPNRGRRLVFGFDGKVGGRLGRPRE